ncbi:MULTISPECIES: hypothetical protein [Rhizobium]|uniref:Uncharacterized protein n=1 Tax=Rhizobium favelukesii TaxID=348824 RepID=W6RC56_9HYPH|nr:MULTISPECIES: hypothetical protein [Rhizobium]MCS0462988.1 hypothetical protein [Rhizobium favelukesii]UFS82050.1 hypothetical protein LPB79_27835 [Rhizobium sp. T136]CDM56278.1 hypothetical protein LPU83_0596 [Rhizobium favelukesii]
MDLIATRRMSYGTRRLLPGDRFTAPSQTARVLIAIKKAKAAGAEGLGAEPAKPLAVLRTEYQAVTGKRPFHGWDAETLKTKIAEAKDAN